jgi:hypothetical protein
MKHLKNINENFIDSQNIFDNPVLVCLGTGFFFEEKSGMDMDSFIEYTKSKGIDQEGKLNQKQFTDLIEWIKVTLKA